MGTWVFGVPVSRNAAPFCACVSRKENVPESHIINPLLTKLFGQDDGILASFIFWRVYGLSHLNRTSLVNKPYFSHLRKHLDFPYLFLTSFSPHCHVVHVVWGLCLEKSHLSKNNDPIWSGMSKKKTKKATTHACLWYPGRRLHTTRVNWHVHHRIKSRVINNSLLQ